MIKPVEKMEGEDSVRTASPGSGASGVYGDPEVAIESTSRESSGEVVVSGQKEQEVFGIDTDEAASEEFRDGRKYVPYTVKIPSDQLAALQSIWLELKKLYGTHSPDKSGMIQAAIADWLKRWDSADRDKLLNELLEIRQNTRQRQYRKGK